LIISILYYNNIQYSYDKNKFPLKGFYGELLPDYEHQQKAGSSGD